MKWKLRWWGRYYAWCITEPRGSTVAWINTYDEAFDFLRTHSALGQL